MPDTLDKKTLKEIEIIAGDIRDLSFLLQITKKIDVILHLAALISIPYSYKAPYSSLESNIRDHQHSESAKLMVRKVIMTSTSEVYGTAQQVPQMKGIH